MISIGRITTPLVHVKILNADPMYNFWIAARNCYHRGPLKDLYKKYTPQKGEELFKKIIDMKHDSCLEHIQIQITLEGVSRSYMAQITRHRHVVFHISSQHFQNHSDFLFVMPEFKTPKAHTLFLNQMETSNIIYKQIIAEGESHYIARQVLPNAAACKIIMTVNLRELRLILELRHGIENTPEMQKVSKMIINSLDRQNPMFLYGTNISLGGE